MFQDVFNLQVPAKDTSFVRAIPESIPSNFNYPVPLSENLFVRFPISSSNLMIDALSMALHVKAKLFNMDGSLLAEAQQCAVGPGLLYTMIAKIELSANGRIIAVYEHYPYLSFTQQLLHLEKDYINDVLGSTTLFYLGNNFLYPPTSLIFYFFEFLDTAEGDDITWGKTLNKGLAERRKRCGDSALLDMKGKNFLQHNFIFLNYLFQGRLFVPNFMTERFLPSKCNWELKITFAPNDFVCMAKEGSPRVKLMIYHLQLDFNRIQLSDQAAWKVTLDLKRNGMLALPFLNYSIQSFNIPDGIQLLNTPAANIRGSPRRVYIFMVLESAVVGNQKYNPMHFQNFYVESIKLNMAGREYSVTDMDFKDNGNFFIFFIILLYFLGAISAYFQTVCRGLGITNRAFAYNYHNFIACYTIFCFDTTTTTSSAGCQVRYKIFLY